MSPAPGWYPDPEAPSAQRWWNGEAWTNDFAPGPQVQVAQYQQPMPFAVVQQRPVYKTSHGFHLIMSLITFGLWIPVWIIVGIMNAARS